MSRHRITPEALERFQQPIPTLTIMTNLLRKEPTMTTDTTLYDEANNRTTIAAKALGIIPFEYLGYTKVLQAAMAHGVPLDLLLAAVTAHTRYGMTAQDLERLAAPITITAHDPTAKDKPMDTKSDVYTASNGTEVHIDDRGYLLATGGTGEPDAVTQATGGADFGVQALREFFQHERDLELGRWRDPDNPNMVVYRTVDSDTVMVLNENDGVTIPENRGTFSQRVTAVRVGLPGAAPTDPPHATTAARYFAAHPEPKPWHDAKGGEAWILTINDDLKLAAVATRWEFETEHNQFSHDDPMITHAERVWPVDE